MIEAPTLVVATIIKGYKRGSWFASSSEYPHQDIYIQASRGRRFAPWDAPLLGKMIEKRPLKVGERILARITVGNNGLLAFRWGLEDDYNNLVKDMLDHTTYRLRFREKIKGTKDEESQIKILWTGQKHQLPQSNVHFYYNPIVGAKHIVTEGLEVTYWWEFLHGARWATCKCPDFYLRCFDNQGQFLFDTMVS